MRKAAGKVLVILMALSLLACLLVPFLAALLHNGYDCCGERCAICSAMLLDSQLGKTLLHLAGACLILLFLPILRQTLPRAGKSMGGLCLVAHHIRMND